ncbi:MAG TPA: hypothetical protein ENJ54_04225 [Chloroflexi bacterium]|nr:hypothetical protein [Chloroflexota bacterium]
MDKVWKCPNGHILGLARRQKVNGRWVTRLLLYREAVDTAAERPAEVDVVAAIEGTALDVRCSVCGAVRSWSVGQDALERLLASVYRSHDHARALKVQEP